MATFETPKDEKDEAVQRLRNWYMFYSGPPH